MLIPRDQIEKASGGRCVAPLWLSMATSALVAHARLHSPYVRQRAGAPGLGHSCLHSYQFFGLCACVCMCGVCMHVWVCEYSDIYVCMCVGCVMYALWCMCAYGGCLCMSDIHMHCVMCFCYACV